MYSGLVAKVNKKNCKSMYTVCNDDRSNTCFDQHLALHQKRNQWHYNHRIMFDKKSLLLNLVSV